MQTPQLEPGKKLTDSEKAALAKDNERISKQAAAQAHEQAEIDRRAGRKPVVAEVAESIKERLQQEDFTQR